MSTSARHFGSFCDHLDTPVCGKLVKQHTSPPRSFASLLRCTACITTCIFADVILAIGQTTLFEYFESPCIHVYHTFHNSGRPVYSHSFISSHSRPSGHTLTYLRLYKIRYIRTSLLLSSFNPPRTLVTLTLSSSLVSYIPIERYMLRVRIAGQFADLHNTGKLSLISAPYWRDSRPRAQVSQIKVLFLRCSDFVEASPIKSSRINPKKKGIGNVTTSSMLRKRPR
jgi:hypothetical protein